MAATDVTTMLANLVDPEVLADFIDKKLTNAIRLSPLATVRNDLVGRPGDEITLPSYSYIGDATFVGEGQDIPIARLNAGVAKVKVAKIGKAVEITDEAILSAAGDITSEAGSQILTAMNSGVENQLLQAMRKQAILTDTVAASGDPANEIADALTLFGEDIDGDKVIAIPPSFYARLRKSSSWIPNTEMGAQAIIRGTIGMVHGCQVITANRLNAHDEYDKTTDTTITSGKTYYELVNGVYTEVATPDVDDLPKYYEKVSVGAQAFIVKPNALAIYMKRNTLVEFDRDKIAQLNYIIGSKLFAPYVYDTSKLIKLTLA